jgi:DNA-binding SARP family transcriptional activator
MDFKILGTLEVCGDDGSQVAIRQPRQRHLLTVLLLHANQSMTVNELITALWDSSCDGSLVGALRTHIWSLRRLLAPADRLTKEVRGYVFQVRPGELDLDMFWLLAEQGRRAMSERRFCEAEGIIARAIGLWSTPRLTDLPPTPAIDIASQRLIGERDTLLELLTDARMALGQHRELVPELEAQVAAEPANEKKWAQLLLALYRSGRQVRALDAYSRVREMLVTEYGIDPGPQLRQLHSQILRADPTLDPPLECLEYHH